MKQRCAVFGGSKLSEATYDKTSGKLTITVIKPGFNTSKSRYYTEAALRSSHKVFDGAKMFVNHQTAAEERARPEGNIDDWAATLNRTWVETDGSIKADAVVIDPFFKAKLDRLAETNLLGEMGVSIRAIGEAHQGEVEGHKTTVVESFLAARSVDFVTYPGAGGRVEAIESDRSDPNDVDLVDIAELRKRRPDLVQLIEADIQKENQMSKTVEQLEKELKEAQDKLTAETQKSTDLTTKLTESETATKKANAAVELEKQLKESKLPEPSKTRLRTQFKEASEVTGFKEAITTEEAYVKSITPGGVKNLGTEQSQESDKKIDLVESFKKMGLSEDQAKIAAKGR